MFQLRIPRCLKAVWAGTLAVLTGLTFTTAAAAPQFVAAPDASAWLVPATRSGDLSSEETAALARLNERRAQLGLPVLNRSSLIDAAARGHSNYLVCNNTTGHGQNAALSCYTGASVGERVRAAGYQWTSVYEVVSAGPSSGAAAIDSLIKAIYHRFALFATDVSEIGIGMMGGHPTYGTVLTANPATNQSPRPAMGASWIGVYPGDGQTDVPRDFDSDTESPDPVPGRNKVGYPVSLHVDRNLTLSVSSFTLSKGGVNVAGLLLPPGGSSTPGSVAAFIPLDALDHGATYTARFIGSAGGMAIDKTWSFSTGALEPIRFCPSNPVSGPHLTFTLQLAGGSGRFTRVRWSTSGSPITDLRWVGDTALSITTGTGGSATITVQDSDGREASTTLTVRAGAGIPSGDCAGGSSPAPAVALSANDLDFGPVDLGTTSAARRITLTNSGTATLNLTALGAGGDFQLSHDCPASLAAGGSCTFSVVFQPTVAGSRTGTLTIASNASGSPHTVTLTGTGMLSVAPAAPRFAAQVSGPNHRQDLSLNLTPASADAGQTREIYVAAINGDDLFFFDGLEWRYWADSSWPPLWRNTRLSGSLSIPLASGMDVTALCGIHLAVGYGRSFEEMVIASRYAVVHTLCQP